LHIAKVNFFFPVMYRSSYE